MKIFSYIEGYSIKYAIASEYGFAEHSEVIKPVSGFPELLNYISENFESVKTSLDSFPEEKLKSLEKANFCIPLSEASKAICVGLNYAEHAKEGFQEVSNKYPVFFLRLNSSFVAHHENLILPKVSTKYDYEAELAIVIGKNGRHIPEERAGEHILGYTLANDGSVRDFQKRTPQWTLGKNFDSSGSIGPYIITKDELPEKAKGLKIRSILNGQVMQDGNTADMIYDLYYLISQLSQVMTLNAGDIILTGTPAGVGFARNPMVFMKDGDEIIIEVEKVGRLVNRVVAEK